MQQYFFLSLMLIVWLVQPARAQQHDQLTELKDHTVRVYYSAGHSQRAASIAERVDKAMDFNQQLLDFKPRVTLLILGAADWPRYTSLPVVYGMPHYTKDTLIVAAEDNAFWKSFLPPLEQLPKDLSEQVQSVYRDTTGKLSMRPFFDLLALHELGHAFHLQASLNMQRKWMGELFVNILLHTYIAEKEPGGLTALTLFPQMVINGSAKEFSYTSLKDIEEHYNEIAMKYPRNYGWYQCRWHSAAAGIYDAGKKESCRKLWDILMNKKEKLTDEQLIAFLETNGIKTIADMMRNWNKETIR